MHIHLEFGLGLGQSDSTPDAGLFGICADAKKALQDAGHRVTSNVRPCYYNMATDVAEIITDRPDVLYYVGYSLGCGEAFPVFCNAIHAFNTTDPPPDEPLYVKCFFAVDPVIYGTGGFIDQLYESLVPSSEKFPVPDTLVQAVELYRTTEVPPLYPYSRDVEHPNVLRRVLFGVDPFAPPSSESFEYICLPGIHHDVMDKQSIVHDGIIWRMQDCLTK